MVLPGFVFWWLTLPGFGRCLGATAPKLLRGSAPASGRGSTSQISVRGRLAQIPPESRPQCSYRA